MRRGVGTRLDTEGSGKGKIAVVGPAAQWSALCRHSDGRVSGVYGESTQYRGVCGLSDARHSADAAAVSGFPVPDPLQPSDDRAGGVSAESSPVRTSGMGNRWHRVFGDGDTPEAGSGRR